MSTQLVEMLDAQSPKDIHNMVVRTGLGEFVKYLLMFYGNQDPNTPYPMGLTQEHAEYGAVLQVLTHADTYSGDSVDREQCINLLINKFGYAYPETSAQQLRRSKA